LGHSPQTSGSCAVAPAGGTAPASPPSLAGLLAGVALFLSRRRR
jgi:MYXO-CTERM domain-containing protein